MIFPRLFGILFCISFVRVAYGAVVGDECTTAEKNPGPICCKYVSEDNEEDKKKEIESYMSECMAVYLKKPSDGDTSANPKIMILECAGECFFNYSKLLTVDMKLDKEKIIKMNEMYKESPEWKKIGLAAIDTCIDKSASEVKDSAKCNSGSFQFVRCNMRERFFNCPKDLWVESNECSEYKSIVQRCPEIVPGMGETGM